MLYLILLYVISLFSWFCILLGEGKEGRWREIVGLIKKTCPQTGAVQVCNHGNRLQVYICSRRSDRPKLPRHI